jgi:NADH-quinone oxidoreductase subunit K
MIGVYGIASNIGSIISLLISIEVMLLAVNINFVSLSRYWGNYDGQIFSLFILTVAAAEAAIGLAILICYFRNKGDIEISNIKNLKG